MKLLFNRDIYTEQLSLAADADSVDIATFNYGPGCYGLLNVCCNLRILFGWFGEEDLTRVQAFAAFFKHKHYPAHLRLISRSHAKIFIAHLPGGRASAIIGSANLGAEGSHETAVRIEGLAAKDIIKYFDSLWLRGLPVKPLDLNAAKAALESSDFESQGRRS